MANPDAIMWVGPTHRTAFMDLGEAILRVGPIHQTAFMDLGLLNSFSILFFYRYLCSLVLVRVLD